MTTIKSKTVAFTGHRTLPQKTEALYEKIEEAISDNYNCGKRYFLCGLAEGFDMLAGEAVVNLRGKCPEIKLIAVIPFPDQPSRFCETDRRRYESLLKEADDKVVLSNYYYTGCFHRRNDYLVDNAALMIAGFDNKPQGGTYYTVSRAIRQQIPVRNLLQAERLMFGMFGNGVGVCDRSRERHSDYLNVAHISYERQVKFYDSDLSITAKASIEHFARFDNMTPVSQREDYALKPLKE